LQEQAAILAFNRGGRPTCSSSPTVGQAAEGHALLDQQGVEVTQEPNRVTATVLTHETDFDAIGGEWDALVSSSCQHGVFLAVALESRVVAHVRPASQRVVLDRLSRPERPIGWAGAPLSAWSISPWLIQGATDLFHRDRY